MTDIPTLATARLLLRPFDLGDAPEVERLAGMREVADTTLRIPHPYPAGGGAEWIATHAPGWARRQQLTLAMVSNAAPHQLIGSIGLALSMKYLHAELGYWVAFGEWGKGYATEASRAMIAYAFETLGLHRVQAHHFARNPASGRVMQKIGMRREGVHRDVYRRGEQFETIVSYAILATDAQ